MILSRLYVRGSQIVKYHGAFNNCGGIKLLWRKMYER